ncbi:MAG TPA: hypothetical protein VKN82_08565 [Desulfohalobiaceae bacterium]|nr:hypothetical protein [Desulfohalobiaceae bacterium]
MKLYVGNPPFNHNDDELQKLFTPYDQVISAKVITDHFKGQKNMESITRVSINSREIVVNEACKDKKPHN